MSTGVTQPFCSGPLPSCLWLRTRASQVGTLNPPEQEGGHASDWPPAAPQRPERWPLGGFGTFRNAAILWHLWAEARHSPASFNARALGRLPLDSHLPSPLIFFHLDIPPPVAAFMFGDKFMFEYHWGIWNFSFCEDYNQNALLNS